MKHKILILFLFTLLACGERNEKEEAILKEAAQIHNEAMALYDSLKPIVKEMNLLKAQLLTKKDSIRQVGDTATSFLEKQIFIIDEVSDEIKTWTQNIVEVPNNEEHHAHHEEEEHHHNHESKIDITPDQMLEIQKEIKANILIIKQKIILIQVNHPQK